MWLLRKIRYPFDMIVLMLTPACERIVREASEHMDGAPLTGFQRFYIEIHMMCCKICDNYINNVRTLRQALRRLTGRADPEENSSEEPTALGQGLADSARDRMIEHLKKHKGG